MKSDMLKLQRTPTKSSFGFEEFEDDSCGFFWRKSDPPLQRGLEK